MIMMVMFMITMIMMVLRVMMLTAIMVVMFTCLPTPLEESAEMKIADPRLGNGGNLATCSIVGMRTFYPEMETGRRDESKVQLHFFLDPLVSLVSILRASVSFIA